MKKYSLIALVLTLSACGGGGGGSDGGNGGFIAPAVNMPGNVQSWSSTTHKMVQAKTADNDDVFTFHLDSTGEILSVDYDNRHYARRGNENAYVNTDDGVTRTMNLATFGRDAGLTYADFGYAQEYEFNQYFTDREFEVFGGGAVANEYKGNQPMATTYTGTAVAYIQADTPTGIANQVSKTDDAKLVFDGAGHKVLNMNFSKADTPWYDVALVNGHKIQLTDNDNKVPEQFRVTDDMVQKSLHTGQKFYGPNGATPDEVIHRLNFEMKNETGREIEFDGVFGGKRQ